MPTIHREGGFSFRIYTDDHNPPHVHVWYAGERAKVCIGDGETAAGIEDPGTMRVPNLVRAVRIGGRELADVPRTVGGDPWLGSR